MLCAIFSIEKEVQFASSLQKMVHMVFAAFIVRFLKETIVN